MEKKKRREKISRNIIKVILLHSLYQPLRIMPLQLRDGKLQIYKT